MANLQLRLSDQAHQLLSLHCQSSGESMASFGREAVESALRERYKLPTPKVKMPRKQESKRKTVLMLTDSEIDAIDKSIAHMGGTRNGWIINAVRASAARQTAFTDAEVKGLNEAIYELRNVRMAVREWMKVTEKSLMNPTDELMAKLQNAVGGFDKKVDKFCASVTKLIDSSRERWPLR